MTIPQRAAFVLAMVSADQLMTPASMARKLAECQDWLEDMSKADELKLVEGNDDEKKV